MKKVIGENGEGIRTYEGESERRDSAIVSSTEHLLKEGEGVAA